MRFIGNRYKHIPAEDCIDGIAESLLSKNKKVRYVKDLRKSIKYFGSIYDIPKRVIVKDDIDFQIYNDEIFEDKILIAFDVFLKVLEYKYAVHRDYTEKQIINKLKTYHQWKNELNKES